VSERYILVESPKKLRLKISISVDRQATGDNSELRKKFEDVLKSKAPSWKITCTSFSWAQEFEIGGRFYYDLSTELIVQPSAANAKPLVFVEFRVLVPSSLSSTAEIIAFDDVVATMFSVPVQPIVATFFRTRNYRLCTLITFQTGHNRSEVSVVDCNCSGSYSAAHLYNVPTLSYN